MLRGFVLFTVFAFSVLSAVAQNGPVGVAVAEQPADAANPDAANLIRLLQERPELTPVLKSYLVRQMTIEGQDISEHSMSDEILYRRIQKDPRFAKQATQWLLGLARATTQTLDTPAATTAAKQKQSTGEAIGSSPTSSNGTNQTAGLATSPSAQNARAHVSSQQSLTDDAATQPLRASQLPKYLLQDQLAFWGMPFRMRVNNLTFLAPATIGTAILVGTDTSIERHLPNSPSTVNGAANASTAGMLGLVGTGAGMYLWGNATHDAHMRETGFLVGEAAIDAYAASTALQYITQRERPFTGNNKGTFFYGGNSFPSNTAAVAWASASVIAHEYPGFLTQLFAYGVASGVSAGRVIGEKHWTSDAVIGSALGWYLGRQVYRARSQGAEIDAKTWGTFEKGPDEQQRDPAYMGTTFMPLDSWVYPAFDRLAAMGYLPTGITSIKPWPRMECARLVLEAAEQIKLADDGNVAAREMLQSLTREFATELANLEGASNVGVELESAYVRVTEIAGRPLRDSFNFAQTLYDDSGRPYGRGFNTVDGGSVRAEAGPLAFYFRGEFQHSSALPNYTPEQAQVIVASNGLPLLPITAVPTFNSVNRFQPVEAYAALNIANWQVSFGYQDYHWGPDFGDSLMFSNNARSEPMLKFGRVVPFHMFKGFGWLGEIRNTAFVGALPGYNWLRGPYPEFPVYGNPYTSVNPVPYTWGDRLALKMTPNLEVGVGLSVIWAGQGRPATLQSWIHTFNSNGNQQRLDPGKRYTGISCSYRVPKLRDWLTFYVDGLANDQPNPIAFPQKSAFAPGLYLPRLPKIPKLDLRVQGVYTNVPGYPGVGDYYRNARYGNGYTIDWQLIGSWVGRQGDGIQAWSTYWFSPRNKLQFGYRRQWVDPVLNGGGGLNDFSGSVDWLIKHEIQISSAVQYERWNFPLLSPTAKDNVSASLQVVFWPTHGARP